MADETAELKKLLETAIARISSLEGELRTKPKEKETPQAFDLVKFRESLIIDPVGTMRAMQMGGEHVEHVRNVLIADKLGDQAPPQMKVFAAQGPQMMAAQAQAEAVATLSRRLDDREKQEQKAAKKESLKAITANKEKYPNLSKALAADPDLAEELEKHTGTAEEFAANQEAKYTKLAAAFVPQTASTSADNKGQSTQTKPTPLASSLNGDTPPIVKENPGEWTRDAYTKVRDSIVHKYNSPKV